MGIVARGDCRAAQLRRRSLEKGSLGMADEASPLKAPVVDEVPPRWCRKCKIVFTAPTCPEGHANFMYTKKIRFSYLCM